MRVEEDSSQLTESNYSKPTIPLSNQIRNRLLRHRHPYKKSWPPYRLHPLKKQMELRQWHRKRII